MQSHGSQNGKDSVLKVVVAIPARYASSRLPGKPLADIAGKTMIHRVVEQAQKASGVDSVLVATDDDRIAREVESFGGEVVMTRSDHPSGTDRLAEVFSERPADVVINVQGDEPFLDPHLIESLIKPFTDEPDLQFATLKTPITDPADLLDETVAKLVVDAFDNVLYFSRSPIPFVRDSMRIEKGRVSIDDISNLELYKHIGLYAYRREFLLEFASWEPAPAEQLEKLEQLRALHHGVRVKAITVSHEGFSVDTPEDLQRANEQFEHKSQIEE